MVAEPPRDSRDLRTVSAESGAMQSGKVMTTRSTWNSPRCTGVVRSGANAAAVILRTFPARNSAETLAASAALPPAPFAPFAGLGAEMAAAASPAANMVINVFFIRFSFFYRSRYGSFTVAEWSPAAYSFVSPLPGSVTSAVAPSGMVKFQTQVSPS